MFALAVIALSSQDPGTLVQRALTVADLRASGKILYRKIDAALRPVGEIRKYGDPFTRVDGDPSILLVTWTRKDVGNPPPPILLYPSGKSTRAEVIGSVESRGWFPGCFRRVGKSLIGAGYLYEGNWSSPLAMAFEWRKESWKLVREQGFERRAWDLRFANRSDSDLVVTIRDYEFKALVAPLAGPARHYDSVWKYREGRFSQGKLRLVNNAIAAFDDLVLAVDRKDASVMRRMIPNQSMRSRFLKTLAKLGPPYHATCPYGYITDGGDTFGVHDVLGGSRASIFCRFAKTRNGWQVVKVGSESEFPNPR